MGWWDFKFDWERFETLFFGNRHTQPSRIRRTQFQNFIFQSFILKSTVK